MYKGSLWNDLNKNVLLQHREAPLFLRIFSQTPVEEACFIPVLFSWHTFVSRCLQLCRLRAVFGLDVLIQTQLKCAAHWMTDSNPGAQSRYAINHFKTFRCSFTREPPTNTGVRVQRDDYTSDSLGLQWLSIIGRRLSGKRHSCFVILTFFYVFLMFCREWTANATFQVACYWKQYKYHDNMLVFMTRE